MSEHGIGIAGGVCVLCVCLSVACVCMFACGVLSSPEYCISILLYRC